MSSSWPNTVPAGRAAGFTYLGVLVLVVIMGTVWGATMEVWHTAMQREKERELLFIGNQFRQAIGLYYREGRQYPARLEDLLKDPRQPATRRYLRKIFHDPMTGKTEWGLLRGPHGEIMGVHSLSEDKPLKLTGFIAADRDFERAENYSAWVFSYKDPQAAADGVAPASGSGAGVDAGTRLKGI